MFLFSIAVKCSQHNKELIENEWKRRRRKNKAGTVTLARAPTDLLSRERERERGRLAVDAQP